LDLFGIKDTSPSEDDPIGWDTISRQATLHGEITTQKLALDLSWIWQRFGKAVAPTGLMLDLALKQGQHVLLEGAQGCLLDIDQGTYPFVTSSVTSRGNATHGAGVHPGHVTETFGVVKAYTTRVGEGPFPTELYDGAGMEDADGKHMADVGHEFGTTTGRPRRCGWLDLVLLRHAHRMNGFDGVTLTKLDVLGGLSELKICVGYTIADEPCHEVPADIGRFARCEPVYDTIAGFPSLSLSEWLEIARTSRREGSGFAALPEAARAYVEKVESLLGFPIISVGVGPDREATIERV
jgi:adenylosuccinate synthase